MKKTIVCLLILTLSAGFSAVSNLDDEDSKIYEAEKTPSSISIENKKESEKTEDETIVIPSEDVGYSFGTEDDPEWTPFY